MSDFQANLQILANAGSGKTHTLITRIIRLLVLGVHPRRIIALTFTRKAAGEFLGKLLHRLSEAAIDPEKAAELSKAIHADKNRQEYQQLLKAVIRNLGSLQLTTLDSFFHRIVAAFPQELGLSASPQLLDPHSEELAAAASLRHALSKLTQEEKNFLIQALFERDDEAAPRSASRELTAFRKEVHELLLDHPDPANWGNPKRIWGENENPWKSFSPADLEYWRLVIAKETGSPEFSDALKKAWNQLQSLTRGTKGNVITTQILEHLSSWKEGAGSITYNRKKYALSPEASKAAATLAEQFLHESIEYRLREARAIHQLLSLYEKEYGVEVRGRGKLTFSDVTRLLQPDDEFHGISEHAPSSAPLRLQLDERLDGLFDHWLLDEFQDTSRNQFRALENILDEVISEAARGGERSFFCVGDIKQAIYAWRSGDARLFDEIYQRYHLGGGLKREPLSISWRSSPEVLAALNAVFGDLGTTAPGLPEEVRKRWENAWTTHESTSLKPPLPGYFSWMTYQGDKEEDRKLDLQERVVALLESVQSYLKQGMTIALLVRSGKEANEWLEVLRFAGIEALSESNPPVGRDNPVAAALHSALSLSIHPGDCFARNHLAMEPLRGIFFSEDTTDNRDLAAFSKQVATLLVEGGCRAVTEWMLKLLEPLIRDDFSKERAASLNRAARKADTAGIKDIDDFLTFLKEYVEQGRSSPNAVQVMTVHKAKGLEYDMVLLPFPARQEAIASLGKSDFDCWHNEAGEPFLMKLPPKEIRSVAGNETFASAAELKKQEDAFEELCVWYVAMSRAKQALYLFTQPIKKLEPEKCPNFPQLLAAGLEHSTSFESRSDDASSISLGDPLWFEKFHLKAAASEQEAPPCFTALTPRDSSLQKALPSDAGHTVLRGSQAFLENNAAALGSEVHSLFESLEWLPTSQSFASCSDEARELMESSLANPQIQSLFAKPEGKVTLWREQHFDLLQEGLWLSGCFDRVVIFHNEEDRVVRADLIDFKTDQGGREKLLANYRPQLESYRRALAQILHLEEKQIRMILLHLRSSEPVLFL